MADYGEIHLRFQSGFDSYRVGVTSSAAGSTSAETQLDLSRSTLLELQRRITVALQQSRPHDAGIEDELERLGEQLYGAIFPMGPVHVVLTRALWDVLRSPEEQRHRLLVFLHFDPRDPKTAWLAEFPWDVLRVPLSPVRHAALDRRLSIARLLDVTPPPEPQPVVGPLKVLLVRAGAQELGGLELGLEQDSIIEALSSISGIECRSLDMPRRLDLQRMLRDFNPHVLHLMGHGKVDEGTGSGWVYLRNDEGRPIPLRPRDLAEIVSGLSLRLVVLNACQSARGPLSGDGDGSFAEALVSQGVGAVIAMQFTISDKAARVFAAEFYERLAKRATIDDAVTEGRLAMRMDVPDSFEWCTPTLYMRSRMAGVLLQPAPLNEPPPVPAPPRRSLILIRHEAYTHATEQPGPEDARAFFAGREPQVVAIDQTVGLKERDWRNLDREVKRLAAREGDLMRALEERDADIGYYGFPFVPLAVLAGYLAKNRPVHVFEYVSGRFRWNLGSDTPPPPLIADVQTRGAGKAARIRVSVSAFVGLEDCRQVLPDSEVMLDLHFTLAEPDRNSVRSEEQLKSYVQTILETLNKHIASNRNPDNRPESVHLFAAVPVSLAFSLGEVLTPSWLPECFVYNYGIHSEQPRYKWRLSLQAAFEGKRSVKIFKQRGEQKDG